jgi:hypothetical protein
VKTTGLNTLHKLAVSYLRPQLQSALWTEENKYHSQDAHLVRLHQSSHLQWKAHKTKESRKKKKKKIL